VAGVAGVVDGDPVGLEEVPLGLGVVTDALGLGETVGLAVGGALDGVGAAVVLGSAAVEDRRVGVGVGTGELDSTTAMSGPVLASCSGRTKRYSTRTRTKARLSSAVEVRGRAGRGVIRSRSVARCRGRPAG
jgi:hypothetical protein